jgi:hypothetical protein
MFFSTAGTGCSSITRATILLLYFKLQSEPTKKARRTTEWLKSLLQFTENFTNICRSERTDGEITDHLPISTHEYNDFSF